MSSSTDYLKVQIIVILAFISSYCVKAEDVPLLKYRPLWLKTCRRNDPKINECLNDLFKYMFPALENGIPEINVPRFEPLHLDKVSVSKGSGAVTLAGSFHNLSVAGPSNATPTFTQLDLPNKRLKFGIDLPLLDIKSQYNLQGKILVLPLVGEGKSHLVLRGVKTKVSTWISFYKVQGRELFHIDKMAVEFTVDNVKVRLENLFKGNKVLGTTVNNFVNQHSKEIVEELSENIAESLAEIFTDLMNNIFSKMPTNLWLPEDDLTEIPTTSQIATTVIPNEELKKSKNS